MPTQCARGGKENAKHSRSSQPSAVLALVANRDPSLRSKVEVYENRVGGACEDLIQAWVDYVQWLSKEFPDAGADKDALERACFSLADDERHRNDLRYLRLWVSYAGKMPDALQVFQTIEQYSIGRAHTLLYEAWAVTLERAHKFDAAESTYELGRSRCAQPADRLELRFQDFIERMKKRAKRDRKAPTAVAKKLFEGSLEATAKSSLEPTGVAQPSGDNASERLKLQSSSFQATEAQTDEFRPGLEEHFIGTPEASLELDGRKAIPRSSLESRPSWPSSVHPRPSLDSAASAATDNTMLSAGPIFDPVNSEKDRGRSQVRAATKDDVCVEERRAQLYLSRSPVACSIDDEASGLQMTENIQSLFDGDAAASGHRDSVATQCSETGTGAVRALIANWETRRSSRASSARLSVSSSTFDEPTATMELAKNEVLGMLAHDPDRDAVPEDGFGNATYNCEDKAGGNCCWEVYRDNDSNGGQPSRTQECVGRSAGSGFQIFEDDNLGESSVQSGGREQPFRAASGSGLHIFEDSNAQEEHSPELLGRSSLQIFDEFADESFPEIASGHGGRPQTMRLGLENVSPLWGDREFDAAMR